jgi:hypothetical protein
MAPERVKRLQQIVGTFLYYARAVDSTMLPALSTLASLQTKATVATEKSITQFLDYAATNPQAIIRYQASDMALNIHSDASYLSESEARSRAGGIFFLSSQRTKDNPHPTLNGAIHITSTIMHNVLSSVAEAEVAACFLNAQEACPIQVALTTMGHPQKATPIQTDNDTAEGILNNTVKQRRSKAIDMRYYWLRDRAAQDQFEIYWQPGKANYADYFTKHHSPALHKEIRQQYIQQQQFPT